MPISLADGWSLLVVLAECLPLFLVLAAASCLSIASFFSLHYQKMTIFSMIQDYLQVSLLYGFAIGTLFVQQVAHSRFPSL